ncbi:MAG: hypothetical protein AAF762_00070 [Pseudomonadota bacterium]
MGAHVLIGFAEALPAPEVVFSLLDAGHRVSAFARSDRLPLSRLPLDGLHILPPPEVDAPATRTALVNLVAEIGVDVVLPLDDAGLWLAHGAGLGDTLIAGGGAEASAIALDKTAQVAAAEAAGLSVPPTVAWDGAPGEAPHALPLPAIAKPGRALFETGGKLDKGDMVYLMTEDDAAALYASNRQDDGPWLIQPLIAGRGEGVFGTVATDGTVAGWAGHRRVRMMNPHGSGASACESLAPDETLKGHVTGFLTRIGWRGPFMVEMLRAADGTAWFMELNGRMWGSMALARRQGFEYPAWSVAQALDPDFVPDAPEVRPLVVRHLGRDLLHLAFTARGPKSAFHRDGWPSLMKSLPAVLRPGQGAGFYNHDPAHPRYFLHDALWTVRKTLAR